MFVTAPAPPWDRTTRGSTHPLRTSGRPDARAGRQDHRPTGGVPTYAHGPKLLWWLQHRPTEVADAAAVVMPAASWLGAWPAWQVPRRSSTRRTYTSRAWLIPRQSPGRANSSTPSAFPQSCCRASSSRGIDGRGDDRRGSSHRLRAGTPIAAGCGTRQRGCWVRGGEVGAALDVAGSASVLAVCVPRFEPDEAAMLFTARTVLADRYYSLAYVQGGGLNLGWFREHLRPRPGASGRGPSHHGSRGGGRRHASRSDGVRFAPHLGGRVTPNDPRQRGVMAGLTWQHDRGSPLPGGARGRRFRVRLVSVGHPRPPSRPGEVVVRGVGGGSASSLWGQIKADVLGVTYRPLARQEGGALGSATDRRHAVG